MRRGDVKKAIRLTVGVGGCLNVSVCVCVCVRAQCKCRHSVVPHSDKCVGCEDCCGAHRANLPKTLTVA